MADELGSRLAHVHMADGTAKGLPDEHLIPGRGTQPCAELLTSLGARGYSGIVVLEVFLFDFSGDLYGRTIDVAFSAWIRPEMMFDTVADLVRRMDEDCRLARNALQRAGDVFPPLGELAG